MPLSNGAGVRLEYTGRAKRDLDEITEFIARDNIVAAERLRAELDTKISLLPTRPEAYRRGRIEGTREMVVRRNYVVVYRAAPDRVTVLRVLQAARQWP